MARVSTYDESPGLESAGARVGTLLERDPSVSVCERSCPLNGKAPGLVRLRGLDLDTLLGGEINVTRCGRLCPSTAKAPDSFVEGLRAPGMVHRYER